MVAVVMIARIKDNIRNKFQGFNLLLSNWEKKKKLRFRSNRYTTYSTHKSHIYDISYIWTDILVQGLVYQSGSKSVVPCVLWISILVRFALHPGELFTIKNSKQAIKCILAYYHGTKVKNCLATNPVIFFGLLPQNSIEIVDILIV